MRKTERLNLRIDPDLFLQIRKLAAATGRSVSKLTREGLAIVAERERTSLPANNGLSRSGSGTPPAPSRDGAGAELPAKTVQELRGSDDAAEVPPVFKDGDGALEDTAPIS